MKQAAIWVLGLALMAGSAGAEDSGVVAADDYSACIPLPAMGMIPYTISEDGHLKADPSNKSISSMRKGEDKDVLSVVVPFQPFGVKDKKARKLITTYTLNRENGRAKSLEAKFSRNFYEGFKDLPMPILDVAVTEFSFQGKKCQVERVYQKSSKEPGSKPQLSYDRKMCADLLAAAKAMGGKKISECVSELSKVKGVIQQHKSRLEAEGYEHNPWMYLGAGSKEEKKGMDKGLVNADWAFMGAIGHCNFMQYTYEKKPYDPDLQLGMGFMGGGFGVKADDKKEETKSAQ